MGGQICNVRRLRSASRFDRFILFCNEYGSAILRTQDGVSRSADGRLQLIRDSFRLMLCIDQIRANGCGVEIIGPSQYRKLSWESSLAGRAGTFRHRASAPGDLAGQRLPGCSACIDFSMTARRSRSASNSWVCCSIVRCCFWISLSIIALIL